MKNFMKFIAITVASAVVAFAIGVVALAISGSANVFVCVYVFAAMLLSWLLGAFRSNDRASIHDSIRHKAGLTKKAA